MIKFICSEKEESLRPKFGMVEMSQFFVDSEGFLCQKTTEGAYVVIAKPDGTPYSYLEEGVFGEYSIGKILPQIAKIEF